MKRGYSSARDQTTAGMTCRILSFGGRTAGYHMVKETWRETRDVSDAFALAAQCWRRVGSGAPPNRLCMIVVAPSSQVQHPASLA
jgi:hypothetical protein